MKTLINFFKSLTKLGWTKISIDVLLVINPFFIHANDYLLFSFCLFSGITTLLMIFIFYKIKIFKKK